MQPVIKQSNDYSKVAQDIVNNIDKYTVTFDEKLEQKAAMLLERGRELNRIKAEQAAKREIKRKLNTKVDVSEFEENNRGYGEGRRMGD